MNAEQAKLIARPIGRLKPHITREIVTYGPTGSRFATPKICWRCAGLGPGVGVIVIAGGRTPREAFMKWVFKCDDLRDRLFTPLPSAPRALTLRQRIAKAMKGTP